MLKFKYPKIEVPNDLLSITDEMLADWEKENKECEEYNEKLILGATEAKKRILSDAVFIWGENSNPVRYLRKIPIYTPSLTFFDSVKSKVLKAQETEKEKQSIFESRQKLINLKGKAVEYLLSKGKIININFTLENVLSIANTIAHEEEVLRRQRELSESNTFVDFNGSDNCENCKGWDGSSRRCQCGNRRVYWTSDDNADFFLNPHIYAEAY